MKQNIGSNEGFSLVEMVVTVLITGILMLAVGVFISISNDMFQVINTSSRVQDEALTTKKFMSEILYEAVNLCESSDDAPTKYWIIKSMDNADGSTKLAGTSIDYDYYIFIKNDNKIHYAKVKEENESLFKGICEGSTNEIDKLVEDDVGYVTYIAGNKDSKYNIISNYVEYFDIEVKSNNLYEVTITYKYLQKEYTTSFSVNSRNKAESVWDK